MAVTNSLDLPTCHRGKKTKLLSVQDVATRMGVAKATVVRWVNDHTMPSPDFTLSEARAWHPSSIDRWVEDLCERNKIGFHDAGKYLRPGSEDAGKVAMKLDRRRRIRLRLPKKPTIGHDNPAKPGDQRG